MRLFPYRVDNYFAFFSAILGFVGTLVIAMDRFGPIHHSIDRLGRWQNISTGLRTLDTLQTKLHDGQMVGLLQPNSPGFNELAHIISLNRPDFREEDIGTIVKNAPVSVGGVDLRILHIARRNTNSATPIGVEYMLYDWVKDYRQKCFLKYGLSLIGLGFMLSIFSRIRRYPQLSIHNRDHQH